MESSSTVAVQDSAADTPPKSTPSPGSGDFSPFQVLPGGDAFGVCELNGECA